MKRKTLFAIIITTALIAVVIVYSILSGKDKDNSLETSVEFGSFEIALEITGELQAINFTEINAPSSLRSRDLRISSILIQDLIPEGTVVDSGDWVATLDKSEADNSLKDILDNLERETTIYNNAKLDSTMLLRQLRDDLFNLEFVIEERKITLEQSKFEPPAVIRQAEIAHERAVREYTQAKNNYDLKVQQSEATIREAEINMNRSKRSKEEMENVLNQFDIVAPSSGMIIYKKESTGQKRTAGSTINPRDLVIATLPDLSGMISVTYVNEIDISRVNLGQTARVNIGAFPDIEIVGKVIYMTNVGEQIPNTNAKVFEVKIELSEMNDLLRPSMTTYNNIVVDVLDSVLFIPIEATHKNDSLTFVYTKEGNKQIVILGEKNENHIIVENGLKEGDILYLSIPQELETFEFTGLELYRKEEITN